MKERRGFDPSGPLRRPRRLGALLGEVERAERWSAAALLALLAGCAPIGCGDASGPEQPAPWGEPFLSLGAQALPAWPTGSVQETPVMLVQRRYLCDGGSDGESCELVSRLIPFDLVTYNCVGLAATIEVLPGTERNSLSLASTSTDPGICDLHVEVRDVGTGATYDGTIAVGFAEPARLAVEHRVNAAPGLHYPVLVGAAFTVLPAVYAATDFNGLTELFYRPEAWEVGLEGEAFECGCASDPAPCDVTIPEENSMEYKVVVHAVAPGTSTLTVRNGDLERVVTLEAVEESAVVDLELYRPITTAGLMDADEDPLERFERVTEIETAGTSVADGVALLSMLLLGDGRRGWGGAGMYESPSADLHLARTQSQSTVCPDLPVSMLTWMTIYGWSAERTTISAQLGSASVEFPVTVLPAQ